MENTNSKKGYRVSFILINLFIAFVVSSLLTIQISSLTGQGTVLTYIVFGLIFVGWITLSVFISKRLWPNGITNTSEVASKQAVRTYRAWVYGCFILILLSLIVVAFEKQFTAWQSILEIVVLVLFYVGLFGVLIVMFYFSGSKNISANQIITYPLQFMTNPEERAAYLKKRIRSNWTNSTIASILVILAGMLLNLGLPAIIVIVVALYGGASYRNAQYLAILRQ